MILETGLNFWVAREIRSQGLLVDRIYLRIAAENLNVGIKFLGATAITKFTASVKLETISAAFLQKRNGNIIAQHNRSMAKIATYGQLPLPAVIACYTNNKCSRTLVKKRMSQGTDNKRRADGSAESEAAHLETNHFGQACKYKCLNYV